MQGWFQGVGKVFVPGPHGTPLSAITRFQAKNKFPLP